MSVTAPRTWYRGTGHGGSPTCVRVHFPRVFRPARITFTTARYAAVTIAIQCDDMSGLPSSGYPYYTSRADGSHSWFGRQPARMSAITRQRERQDEPPKRRRSICKLEALHDGGPFPIATKSQATSVRSTGTHECFLETRLFRPKSTTLRGNSVERPTVVFAVSTFAMPFFFPNDFYRRTHALFW